MPFLLCFSSHFTSCLAKETLKGWNGILLKEYLSDLSEDEIADLEDKVIHLIKAGADLVPPLSLSTLANVGH